jgi:hypothetical protein
MLPESGERARDACGVRREREPGSNTGTWLALSGYHAEAASGRTTRAETVEEDTMATSKITTDHELIRKWVEERGGYPSCVAHTKHDGDLGMLLIDFPGYTEVEGELEHVDFQRWFESFDKNNLAFMYQERTTDGQMSHYNKVVTRETAAQATRSAKAEPVQTGR